MLLLDFLRLPHRFRWGGMGGDDCIMFCASWVEKLTGVDPAATVRGSYHTEDGASALLVAAGGAVSLMGSGIEPLGWVKTDQPATGDVGIVMAPSGLDGKIKQIGAVRFGPLWALLAPAGVRAMSLDHVAAWHFTGMQNEPETLIRECAERRTSLLCG